MTRFLLRVLYASEARSRKRSVASTARRSMWKVVPERVLYFFPLAFAQQPIVYKNAGKLIADRFV